MIDPEKKLLLLSAMEEAPWRRDMELARAFTCCPATVYNYRRALGLPLNPNGAPRVVITDEQVMKVLKLKGRMTRRQAANRVGKNITADIVRHYWSKVS